MFTRYNNKLLLLMTVLVFVALASSAFAVKLESGIPVQVNGQQPLAAGTEVSGLTISQFIKYMYYFVLGMVGVAVFASLVFWGVVWISSGIVDKRAMALGKIKDAFFGLAIALGAVIILNTINPDLLQLKKPTIITTDLNFFKGLAGIDYQQAKWMCYKDFQTKNDLLIISGTYCQNKTQLTDCSSIFFIDLGNNETEKAYCVAPYTNPKKSDVVFLDPTWLCSKWDSNGKIDPNYYPYGISPAEFKIDQNSLNGNPKETECAKKGLKQPNCGASGLPVVCYIPL